MGKSFRNLMGAATARHSPRPHRRVCVRNQPWRPDGTISMLGRCGSNDRTEAVCFQARPAHQSAVDIREGQDICRVLRID